MGSPTLAVGSATGFLKIWFCLIAPQGYAKRRFYSLEALNEERNTWPTFGSVAVLRFAKKWDVICIIRTTVVKINYEYLYHHIIIVIE